ncbi:hypothetical protein L7F22_049133 [Adiantum nelumboides]|nr:hypothetical protein [Adiantum nelumboides]
MSQGIPKLVSRIVLPILAGCLLVIGVSLYVFCCWHRNSPEIVPFLVPEIHHRKSPESIPPAVPMIHRYSYRELRTATEEFSVKNKVGEGAFSVVYKGTSLDDGSLIAVKKLKQGIRKETEFSSEIAIIGACRHRNLLGLQGWCYEDGEAMLVYKFMRRGSLNRYLYGGTKEKLNSQQRQAILLLVALALEYLHHSSNLETHVLHRDVKPANIILTDNFEAMLPDFGFSCLLKPAQNVLILSGAVGTIGYIAPVVYRGQASAKSDVYGYGVLALDLAYGRKTIIDPCSASEHPFLLD